MTDQQKKYEEAAKEHASHTRLFQNEHSEENKEGNHAAKMRHFLAGASFAEKEAIGAIQFWKDQLEKVTAQRDQSSKFTTEALHENQQLKLAKEERDQTIKELRDQNEKLKFALGVVITDPIVKDYIPMTCKRYSILL
jgi:hypothetical protein